MLVVPTKLMMSPVTAMESPDLNHVFQDNPDIFRNDDTLIVFVMHECSRGTRSFYYPYLSTLPQPDTLLEWGDDALAQLQDR